HLGRAPLRKVEPAPTTKKASEIDVLKGKLQRAIKMEEFEEAAHLRDKIRALEVKKTKSKK
ncbi:UvrB/UvrC motif-containing protein, partial [Candidatus Omnitrophota bacterium]